MDGERFDRFARLLASGINRRGIFRAIAGGLAGASLSLIGEAAEAGPRCRLIGRTCSKHAQCCSGFCPHKRGGHSVCAVCESGIHCGTICCPPDALNGCSEINGPNGPIVGCLCPEGTVYDRAANACHPCGGGDQECRSDDDCCSGACCEGTCCAHGEVCSIEGTCVAQGCCTGTSICGSQTTLGLCCLGEKWASECCCDSGPGKNDGFAHCCTPGVDCLDDLTIEEAFRRCPRGWGISEYQGTCDVPGEPTIIPCCAWDMVPCCAVDDFGHAFRGYVCAFDGICTDAICNDRLGPYSSPHSSPHCCRD
jgi:hypothetical protein